MCTLEQVTSSLKDNKKVTGYYYQPVVALGVNMNITPIDSYFESKDEAIREAYDKIHEGFMLPVGFKAQQAGCIKVKIESISGYPGGPFEVQIISAVSWQL